eukprot:CAMPEP_0117482854 /NCGR_PEP_ID=MMETSP0784-20121206/13633_1 /TAXON_ID=39447 /ORGANISM="" /LENGTH=108 /DNA_ID=CAMNT_0005277361 /DNA_START=1052 /DNA_END=1379 /DNA_ORIENTATION=-
MTFAGSDQYYYVDQIDVFYHDVEVVVVEEVGDAYHPHEDVGRDGHGGDDHDGDGHHGGAYPLRGGRDGVPRGNGPRDAAYPHHNGAHHDHAYPPRGGRGGSHQTCAYS